MDEKQALKDATKSAISEAMEKQHSQQEQQDKKEENDRKRNESMADLARERASTQQQMAAAMQPLPPPEAPKAPAMPAMPSPLPIPALKPLDPLPPLPELPALPGLDNMPVLSPEMAAAKEARVHQEYNDTQRAKQALMMIPGLNLAQDDEWDLPEEILAQLNSY